MKPMPAEAAAKIADKYILADGSSPREKEASHARPTHEAELISTVAAFICYHESSNMLGARTAPEALKAFAALIRLHPGKLMEIMRPELSQKERAKWGL